MADLSLPSKIPKVELHAHLNGSLSKPTLKRLLKLKASSVTPDELAKLTEANLNPTTTFEECFRLFDAIHELVDCTEAVALITRDVLQDFYDDGVRYLELRSTLKSNEATGMTQAAYLNTVLTTIEECKLEMTVRFIVSVNKARPIEQAWTSVHLAVANRHRGVVALDLCGNPLQGKASDFVPLFCYARQRGLKITLHLAEVDQPSETAMLLATVPDRIGHGTFLPHGQLLTCYRHIPIEVCLTSNLLANTTPDLNSHHIKALMEHGHPFIICTDDKGVFSTTLSNEYILAAQLLDLNLFDLQRLAKQGLEHAFIDSKLKREVLAAHFDA
eukprot:m.67726 g.67726  ORF g.67726 m.67726 type:complete len:330 (+) comp14080_c0_seq6:3-992(+)